MKWMTKLRLINWQYFWDETFPVGRQSQISGPQGAGKSSIIDALQTLFIADQHQIKYNKAADDSGKRALYKYIRAEYRGETEYRAEDTTSFILTEFYDDKKDEHFVVGMVADLARGDTHPNEFFFILTPMELKQLKTHRPDKNVMSAAEFRKSLDDYSLKQKTYEHYKNNYRKAFCARMGHLPESFFRKLTKGIAYQPIKNVREFVYSYILDPKEMNIDLMKQNFETYESIREQLNAMEARQNLLDQIIKNYDIYTGLKNRVAAQDYVISRLLHAQAWEKFEKHAAGVENARARLKLLDDQIVENSRKTEYALGQRDKLNIALNGNEQKVRLDALNTEIIRTEREIDHNRHQYDALREQIQKEIILAGELLEWPGNPYFRWSDSDFELLSGIHDVVSELKEDQMETHAEALRTAGSALSEIQTRITMTMGTLGVSINNLEDQKNTLTARIKGLKNEKFTYDPAVQMLKDILTDQLKDKSEVLILCEAMDIRDDQEEWRNAIEGFLNTQRFDLLVNPKSVSAAAAIYERYKKEKRIEGVGLVDTEKETSYLGKPRPNTLASLVVADNPIVKARINHLLGNVMMAKDEQNLRNYQVAVTKSCMSYSGRVFRQMRERSFNPPYIGKKAMKYQLEMAQNQLAEVSREFEQAAQAKKELEKWNRKLSSKEMHYSNIAEKLTLPEIIRVAEAALRELVRQRNSIDTSELERLQSELTVWTERYNEHVRKNNTLIEDRGKVKNHLDSLNSQTIPIQDMLAFTENAWRTWENEHSELLDRAKARWSEAQKETVLLETSIVNWTNNRKTNITQAENVFGFLVKLRSDYKERYGFSGDIMSETNGDFQKIYDKINLDIPKYMAKVEEAKAQSEEQFRTHFIYGLFEAITAAKREFKEINTALKKLPFYQDKYSIKVSPSRDYQRYYSAIMDPDIPIDSGLLFSTASDERTETLKELFDILINGDPAVQEEFKDYRRYLDFDLVFENKEGQTLYYSKSSLTDSGGQKEAPFYIVMLASFYHMYSADPNSMRLVIFDEAFSKMDTASIGNCLKLVKQLGLQIIVVVPDHKVSYVAPHVSTTWVVNWDGICHSFYDLLGMEEINEKIEIRQDAFDFDA
ncbi:ATP-binding protein [Bacteroides sp.]|uniref:ATP-binding protein n=1 Tax=Bacteroides sp. TaxID=29523 RepID=UPI002618C36F|nr:SbcC/MukB-like Walker B domain-containing protein [Bacteroides sp.]MDD3040649.1 SbcC/MukB-like Walker B domain-containing protein [Bacteroides sp.]